MIAVIAVLLALMGIFGTWPVIEHGFWAKVTGFGYLKGIESELHTRIGAYFAPDGWILIVSGIILLGMMFMITTPTLLKIRRGVIGVVWGFFALELLNTIATPLKMDSYAGLIYTVIMLSIAFALSFTQWGSKSALVSSMQGMPTSELDVAKKTITEFIKGATQGHTWKVSYKDDQEASPVTKEISGAGILKIGRDANWANLVISSDKTYVSRRHATLTPQPNGVIIRFIDAKFSMMVNGQLHKPDERMFLENQFNLDVELVAGWGPYLKLEVVPVRKSILHPQSVKNVSDQVLQRYKSARLQIKAALILILFSLLGVGNFSMMATGRMEALYNLKKQELLKTEGQLKKLKGQFQEKLAELAELQNNLKQLQQKKAELEKKFFEEKGKKEELKKQLDSLQAQLEKTKEKLEKGNTRANVQALEEQVRALQDYYLGKSVFLGFVPVEENDEIIGGAQGTVWIGRTNNNYYLITADHVIYPEDYEEDIEGNIQPVIMLITRYREGEVDAKNLSKEDVIPIERSKFTRFQEVDIAVLKLDDIGEYGRFAIPVHLGIEDSVVVAGNFVSWFGFPQGHYVSGSIGFCTDTEDCCILCNTSIYHGASGGPLFKIDNDGNIEAFAVISRFSIQQEQLVNKFALLKEYMFK